MSIHSSSFFSPFLPDLLIRFVLEAGSKEGQVPGPNQTTRSPHQVCVSFLVCVNVCKGKKIFGLVTKLRNCFFFASISFCFRGYKLCQKWLVEVKKNKTSRAEFDKFSVSDHVNQIR